MVVAAGFGLIPLISFLASLIHFGISSWIIFWDFKIGKMIGISTTILMSIWPIFGLVDSFIFLVLLIQCIILIYLYLKVNYNIETEKKYLRVLLTIAPLSLFCFYLIKYLIPLLLNK